MNIGTLVVSLGIDATELYGAEAAMARFGSSSVKTINMVNNSIKQLGMAFRTFGWLATTVLTAPILLFGKAVVKSFADYEYSLAKVQALTGSTASDVKNWTSEILSLAPKLGRGPQELADALYFITSSGIQGAQAMDVLTTSAKAAAAGLGETMEVANLLTSALNAYRGTNLTAAMAGDILVAAVREGKAEASSFATAIGSVIPIASQLGVSFDQVAGGMAAVTLTGASTANAATYLRNILMKFIKPAKQTEDALRQMGSSSAELRNLLKQPNGLMLALERVKELTEKWGVEALGKVFPNIRAMLFFLSLMGKNLDYNKGVMDRVKNSADDLNKAFAIMTGTTKFKMDAAMASLKSGLIELGASLKDTLLPVLEKLVGKFNQWVDRFKAMDDATRRHTISLLAFAALIGPLSLGVSVFLSGINMLIKGVMAAAEAFNWLKVAMISNPWVAAATAILAVGIALAHYIKKTREAAMANDSFNKALVQIQGTVAKLKGLGTVDFAAMTIAELAYAKSVVQAEYAIAQARLVSSESARQNQSWINNLFGAQKQFDKYQDNEINKKKQLREQYEGILQAMDDWGNQWEANLRLMETGGLGMELEDLEGLTSGVNEYKEALDKLNEEYSDQLRNMDAISKYTGGGFYEKIFMRLQGGRSPIDDVMQNLSNNLTYIQKKEDALNQTVIKRRDLYNDISAKINAYSTALDSLLELPQTAEVQGAIEKVIENLINLQDEFDKLEMKKQIFSTLGNAAAQFAFTLGAAFVNTQGAMVALVDIILSTGQQIISMLLAEAAAALIMGNAIKFPIGGLIIGAIAVGALMALWEGYKGSLNNAANMANGGRIPPGYNNDTFRANLSSGETVIPLDRLDDLKSSESRIRLEVDEIRVSNRDLAILLRRARTAN